MAVELAKIYLEQILNKKRVQLDCLPNENGRSEPPCVAANKFSVKLLEAQTLSQTIRASKSGSVCFRETNPSLSLV